MGSCIGIVDSVSPHEVKGYLLDSAPKSVSINEGLIFFPRVNGILLIPNEMGSLVGMITWVGYVHLNSENEVALPKETRMVSMMILGHIENKHSGKIFKRGLSAFPSVGDQIVLPTEQDLGAIIKNDSFGTIPVGKAKLFGNQEVKISVNELFGRHAAVLGNTGSGKSCTIAGLIRSSIKESTELIKPTGAFPNSRFIILDPNGEYSNVFDDLKVDVINFKAQPSEKEQQLRIPAWMWTYEEWANIFRASAGTQKPILRETLRSMRSPSSEVATNPSINSGSTINEDTPIEFPLNEFLDRLEKKARDDSSYKYTLSMITRIRSILKNTVLSAIVGNDPPISLLEWINSYLGTYDGSTIRGRISIIDLSLIPTEVIHLIVGTISRLIFETLQRYRKHYGKELPTVLVMDEAHYFIHKYNDNDEGVHKLCTQTFEQIAREGRKYGFGLLISSQRPAELAQTVLSQCNTFILHRIVNDKDQDMIKRMLPDNMGGVLSELPALPTREVIILGEAIPVPTIVEINELECKYRPNSETPDLWKIWTRGESLDLNWEPIVSEWQKTQDTKSTKI